MEIYIERKQRRALHRERKQRRPRPNEEEESVCILLVTEKNGGKDGTKPMSSLPLSSSHFNIL